MRTVQENRQRTRLFDGRRTQRFGLLDDGKVLGDFAQSFAHRCIHLLSARQEGFQDTRRFPEGMTCLKFGLKAPRFRGRPILKKVSERRKWSAQDNIGFCVAGAAANAWGLDLEPAEERVEHPRPIIMNGPDFLAVRTDPAGFGNFLDLVSQDRILKLFQDRLGIFEQQLELLRQRAPKRARQTTETMPPGGSVLKGRLDNNPHAHGSSPLNEPPAYTDTPKFCPLPEFPVSLINDQTTEVCFLWPTRLRCSWIVDMYGLSGHFL